MSNYLATPQEISEAVEQLVIEADKRVVYITGPNLRCVMERIMNGKISRQLRIILPALTGKEYLGNSFLYQLHKLSGNVRITKKAEHCVICANNGAILISMVQKPGDISVMGLVTQQKEDIRPMMEYCRKLWDGGMPLVTAKK